MRLKIENLDKIGKIKAEYYTPVIMRKLLDQMYYRKNTRLNKHDFDVYREVGIINKNIDRKGRDGRNKKHYKIAHRSMTFSNINYLIKTYFKREYDFGHLNNDTNLYLGVSRCLKFPRFPFKYAERKKQTKKFYRNFNDYVVHHDMFIDLDLDDESDIDSMRRMIRQLRVLKTLLKSCNLTFEIVFSGNRGFKILVYNNCDDLSTRDIMRLSHYLHIHSKSRLGYSFIDETCLMGVESKLMKANFSLVYEPNTEKLRIALPLHHDNFDDITETIIDQGSFDIFNHGNLKLMYDEHYNNYYHTSDGTYDESGKYLKSFYDEMHKTYGDHFKQDDEQDPLFDIG